MKYCLVDVANLMYRARYGMMKNGADIEDVIGMSLKTAIESMAKVFQKFGAEHVVACFDHYSWRKVVYPEYKSTRTEDLSEEDIEVRQSIAEAVEEFREFLSTKTNITVLHHHMCEADDFIARWIHLHPDDHHWIISTDSDYMQLLARNVEIYNGVTNTLYRLDGVYFQDGLKPKKNDDIANLYGEIWKIKKVKKVVKKVKIETEEREMVDPRRMLLEKIFLGDDTDNISRAAPPGIGPAKLAPSLNNIGGIAWQTLMDTYRDDLEKVDGRYPTVADIFKRNEELIDLSKQPDDVKQLVDEVIRVQSQKDRVPKVGMNFIFFCRKHQLIHLGQRAEQLAPMFSTPYRKA